MDALVAHCLALPDEQMLGCEAALRREWHNALNSMIDLLQQIQPFQEAQRPAADHLWRALVDHALQDYRDFTAISNALLIDWIIFGGEYLVREMLRHTRLPFWSDAVANALSARPEYLFWYLPLAATEFRLPAPPWAPKLAGQDVFYLRQPVDCAEIRLFLAAGVPPDYWTFVGYSRQMLLVAAETDALYEKMKINVEPRRLQYVKAERAKKYYALLVMWVDGYVHAAAAAATLQRFFAIVSALPLELQAHLAGVLADGAKCSQVLSDDAAKWVFKK